MYVQCVSYKEGVYNCLTKFELRTGFLLCESGVEATFSQINRCCYTQNRVAALGLEGPAAVAMRTKLNKQANILRLKLTYLEVTPGGKFIDYLSHAQ